jgi:hypothetical protein
MNAGDAVIKLSEDPVPEQSSATSKFARLLTFPCSLMRYDGRLANRCSMLVPTSTPT